MAKHTLRLGWRRIALICTLVLEAIALTAGCWASQPGSYEWALGGSTCDAPCWHGITPGSEASPEEIIEVLQSVPAVGSVWQRGPAEVRWEWRHWPWQPGGYNRVYFLGQQVHFVSVTARGELTVSDIIARYGVPEATTAVGDIEFAVVMMWYPTKGIAFQAGAVPAGDPVLDPATTIHQAWYERPAKSLEVWVTDQGLERHVRPWPGYGPLDLREFDPDA